MNMDLEQQIILSAIVITLLLLLFAVNWRYFRDWVVVFLLQGYLDFLWGSPIVNLHLLEYPTRILPLYYNTNILFELWVFPTLCILYNQITREKGLKPIIFYALFFSAMLTAIEYPLELYTTLIKYMDWSWYTTFGTLTLTFLFSRLFIAFFRWGCYYFNEN